MIWVPPAVGRPLVLATVLALGSGGCTVGPETVVERVPGDWSAEELRQIRSLRLALPERPDPTNRWADDDGAARFGQVLFFDAGLGPSGKVSCATCHDPGRAFTDGRAHSQGIGKTERNAPTIVGTQFSPWLFWDGRADSQWAQAAGPVEAAAEMGSDRVFFAQQLTTRHRAAYEAVFGLVPDLSDADRFPAPARPDADPNHPAAVAWNGMAQPDQALVNGIFANGLKAIAAYERRIVPTDAPFDRYVDSLDGPAGEGLSDSQIRGLDLFIGEAGCTNCHNGPLFTDRAFHNLGLPFAGAFDLGRTAGASQVLTHEFNCRSPHSDATECPELDYLDPAFPDFQQAFKTPSLRNVGQTAPYMHHGEMTDLAQVVAFYNELPGDAASNHRELTLQPLGLSASQQGDLVAFLMSLTGDPLPAELLAPPLGVSGQGE